MENINNLKWLKEKFNFIDSFTVIDITGKIIAKKRFNPRFTDQENEKDNLWALNKHILEVIPSLNLKDSTLLKALETGKIYYEENQEMWNHNGKHIVCNNLTFPIISRGKIIGAIEISKDITHLEMKLKEVNYKNENLKVEGKLAKYNFDDIITKNSKVNKIKELASKIANSTSSVLVCGETGTGKELFVQSIHNGSYRCSKPFIAINCAAIPENLLEGILFGMRKGAFTGAENKKGLFEEADGGTIYLDEINSMPLYLQAKLLRVIQEKMVMPLGSDKLINVDVRILASANKSPKQLLESNELRADLFYRLSTITLNIPALIDRKEDILYLTEFFISKYNKKFSKHILGIDEEVKKLFLNYNWPGNIRELEHIIEAGVNITESEKLITIEVLPAYLENNKSMKIEEVNINRNEETTSLKDRLNSYEKEIITEVMISTKWNVTEAAKILQIPRTTLNYKLNKYSIK